MYEPFSSKLGTIERVKTLLRRDGFMMELLTAHHAPKHVWLFCFTLLLCALPSWSQGLPEPQADPNLVRNAGFENGATDWIVPADTAIVVNEHAHSGKSSLFYTNADPARYKLFSQRLDVQPGQHLLFLQAGRLFKLSKAKLKVRLLMGKSLSPCHQ